MMVWLSYHSPELSLSRHSSSVPWGFTLSGGQDQALTIKVGCVLQVSILTNITSSITHHIAHHITHNITSHHTSHLITSHHTSRRASYFSFKCNLNCALQICQESVAETCGLRTRDFIWKVNDVEVFNKSHAECVKMIKAGGRYRGGWWCWF